MHRDCRKRHSFCEKKEPQKTAPLTSARDAGVIFKMNKSIKVIIITAIVALLGSFTFAVITAKSVMYSPGVSTTEMDTLSYTEVAELMTSRAHQMTTTEYIASNIASKWFWINIFKIWAVMFIVSIASFFITDKWCSN